MGDGTISGKAPSTTPGPSPIASTEVQDVKRKDATNESITTGKNQQDRQPPSSSGRSAETRARSFSHTSEGCARQSGGIQDTE